jgi:DNA-binding XRE family transcriptional regulator
MKIKVKDREKLNTLLVVNGFSKRSFGRAIGVSESYGIQLINGNRNTSPKTAKKVIDILGVKFDDIFFIDFVHKSEGRIKQNEQSVQ